MRVGLNKRDLQMFRENYYVYFCCHVILKIGKILYIVVSCIEILIFKIYFACFIFKKHVSFFCGISFFSAPVTHILLFSSLARILIMGGGGVACCQIITPINSTRKNICSYTHILRAL